MEGLSEQQQHGKGKKLTGAVELILKKKGFSSSDTLESDLAAQGLDISVIEPWRLEELQCEAGDDFELWEEHVPVVELFMRCIRQWRTAGETFLGIDVLALQ